MDKKSILENKEIIQAANEAKEDLLRAEEYFQTVNEPELIDYAIYSLSAAKSRYLYYLRLAKERGITVDIKSNLKVMGEN